MTKEFIDKNDIIEMYGFTINTSKEIIRKTKLKLVADGNDFYENRRLGKVPHSAVKEQLGLK